MPTASDYRSAARTLRSSADDATAAAGRVVAVYGDTGIEGGRYEDVIDRALDASRLNALSIESQCQTAAEECDRRAIICDEYSDAVRAFERSKDRWQSAQAAYLTALSDNPHARGPGRFPTQPATPFAWVEAS